MPTGENTELAGGRVTRSLRKRLTSIDSDVPSRPGTPNSINLQTIPETNTPKKRVTRRASLSTPSALTPGKESTNTPGRRITRRRSVNFSDSEDQAPQIISKEPTIPVVKEEEPEVETPKEKPKRVLRSSSKSPYDSENTKKNKKTTIQEEKQEPEVIILDDSIEIHSLKETSVKKKIRVSIKKENIVDEVETESYSGNGSTPTKKSSNLSATENNKKQNLTVETPRKDLVNSKDKKRTSDAGIVTPVKSASKKDSLQTQITPEKSKSDKGSGKKSKSAQKEKQISDVISSPLIFEQIETSQESPGRKNRSKISLDRGIERLSLTKKNQFSPGRVQSAQNSPIKKNHPGPLKNVVFNEAVDENTVKNVYPKTPGLIKSKSYILDASNDVDKDETFKSKKDQSFEEKGVKSDRDNSDEEEPASLYTKTPNKLKLKAVESSTPIQNSSSNQNKTSEIQVRKEKSDKETDEEEAAITFPTSWTKSVSGTVRETSKIDCIVPEKSFRDKQAQETSNKSSSNASQKSSKTKTLQDDSDVSEAEDDMLEEDDDEIVDEEEDRNIEKSVFLDDEAMEVADGEESMDSEERAYLEENQVPEYGESIGSQDTEDDDNADEVPDEEDAAFVVSDTEVIEEISSSESELETSKKNKLETSKQKKYKRICQPTESSDDELNQPSKKNDTDFCLFVDSSFEDEDAENAKQSGDVKSPKKSMKNKKNDSDIKNKSAVKNKSLKEDSKPDNSKINKSVQEDDFDKANTLEKYQVESPAKILYENNISKKDMARKSEVKHDADIENNAPKDKLLDNEDHDSDTEMEEEEFTTITQRKSEITEISDVSKENEKNPTALKSSEKKKLTKSSEQLTQSPKKKSITTEYLAGEDGLEPLNEKSLNQTKSVDVSANLENPDDSSKKPLNENDNSLNESKPASKMTLAKMSTISVENSDDVLQKKEQEPPTALKSPQKKRLTKSPKRKSINITAQEESDDEKQSYSIENSRKSINKSIVCDDGFGSTYEKSLNESRKSMRESIDASAIDKNLDVSQRKSTDNLNSDKSASINVEKENSNARKSLNASRKSFVRTSTQETNDAEDLSTVEKTKLSLDEESEPEETLSASENPLDTSAGKTLIKAQKLRSSFDQNKSLQNEQTNEPEKSKRRKSIVQHSITRKASESSSDENVEKLPPDSLQNKQSSEPEKSKRRRSIAQHSITRKASESSSDENVEKLPPDSLQNKQSSEPEKSKSRRSIAQHSITRKASESSADSRDESKEILPADTLQCKEPQESKRRSSIAQQSITQKESKKSPDSENEKSKRRESIPQQSITRKASESSANSEEGTDEKSSPEISDNEMESSNDDGAVEAQFSDEENVATDKTDSDFFDEENKGESFLKQNSSRRKSIATNESKLDETFQLDPKSSLSSSLHDSLHRNILRKSLNQSQKRKETAEANRDDINEKINFASDSEEVHNSSEGEEFKIKTNIVSEKGLSVSLNSIQIKEKRLKDNKAIRNSFTIGVSVRKNSSEDEDSSEAEPVAENVASLESEDSADNQDSSSPESKILNLSEENCLEKVKDIQYVGPSKSRKSMSNSILLAPPLDGDINQKKRIKRTSLYLQEEDASNSFVEHLAEEKKKLKKQKRKSNSFCGVVAPSAEDNDIHLKEPRSEKKLKKSFDSEDKVENVNHVLSRCEQMIEAANEAKLKAKLQAKKVKVKKPKWMDKEDKAKKEDDTVEIPLVSKKEIKRKEKMKKDLAKALKQSECVLSKAMEPVKKTKQKNAPSNLETHNINPTKRLETEFLEALVELSNPKKKKAKEIQITPPSDKENSKKKSNKLKYRIEDIHKKIESDIETLETACGTVIVEPSTPQKLRFQHGFRESPKTPIGFIIQNIDSTDKADKKCCRKLKTPSGAFIEEDLSSSKKTNLNKRKSRKRKLSCIEEPTYTLPKTQWTPSGVFVEEDLSTGRPLANSTATQFLVASLNNGKKNKSSSDVISSTTLNKALSFKKTAFQKKKTMQSSREILHVKHRKIINNKF